MTCITNWCPSLGSNTVLIWPLDPNPSYCLRTKAFHHISAAKAYPDHGEVIFTSFWLAAVASSKIPWLSQGLIFPLPLSCLTAHPRLLPFPQIALVSIFTNSVLSLLMAHKTPCIPMVGLLAPRGLSTDAFSKGWWRLGSKNTLGQLQASALLQVEQFRSYKNIAIPFLFVAQLDNFHSEN